MLALKFSNRKKSNGTRVVPFRQDQSTNGGLRLRLGEFPIIWCSTGRLS